jgi:hypothetical protein
MQLVLLTGGKCYGHLITGSTGRKLTPRSAQTIKRLLQLQFLRLMPKAFTFYREQIN